ncbi:MAG: SAM-dependent methyltransferase [Alphaproteobacteria bacterium]|nr:SAM-dependent methyltransferase [Alphaproteobacteria bacterium]
MLESLIFQEIQEKGPLSQSRFMELALQHQTYGYYRSHEAISRDFTTAPEVNQIFGELIGAWAIDYYMKLKSPTKISLVEFGPGRGTLIADFLRVAKASSSFISALTLYLIEINPILEEIQSKTIHYPAVWLERFADLPFATDPLIIIANEFFDTLPTNCYIRRHNVLYERCIKNESGKFEFMLVPRHKSRGGDRIWERSFVAEALIEEICSQLLKRTGVFIGIDYGYEKGEGDSLQALYKGKISDPVTYVGMSDLTCHVDFGTLKKTALSKGLGVLGPIPQGLFLKNLGLDLRLQMLKHQNPSKKAQLEASAQRLIHPQQMGSLFKVMIIFSPPSIKPEGFKI